MDLPACLRGDMTKPKYPGQTRSDLMRIRWADPEYRVRVIASRRAFYSTEKGQEAHAKTVAKRTATMRTPERRAKCSRDSLGRERKTTAKATIHPSAKDLYWAAGFIEGEGSFAHYADFKGCQSHHVSAVQVQREPLERLLSIFGGRIALNRKQSEKWQQTSTWRVSGGRARGVAMTLYPILSPRRQSQVRKMLSDGRRQ